MRRCTAKECGYGRAGGFSVSGTTSTLTDCVADDSYDTSFAVSGDGWVITSCTARNASGDGFQVRGTGTTLNKCVATACAGEGVDNGSTGTIVTGCTFRGNRIDVANHNDGGAAYADPAAVTSGNTFDTGGPTRQCEVDF